MQISLLKWSWALVKSFWFSERATFLVIFSEKNREKFQKNPDRAGKDNAVSTGRSGYSSGLSIYCTIISIDYPRNSRSTCG